MAFSQTEKPTDKAVSAKFEQFYNANQPDSIFSMYSADWAKAVPAEQSRKFLTDTRNRFGAISGKEFIRYEGPFAVYRATSEKAILTMQIAIDAHAKIAVFGILAYDNTLRNKTKLKLPFTGEWYVGWGGDTKELNYHGITSIAQKNAFDILITDKTGKTHTGDGKRNEDYYAFGKLLTTPCDGEIVTVVNGVKDNIPGEMNAFHTGGNTVIIKTENNEYLVFCHFKYQSIKVKEGQKISRGQPLGQCGNSGRSSEPHIHFHIQNMEDVNKATGIKCYFERLNVNGGIKTDYSPIKGDKIVNADF